MADTLRASEQGLKIVERARKRKAWTRTSSSIWWQNANTSRATLRRFWRGLAIQRESFIAICETVGISNWEMVVDSIPLLDPDDQEIEDLYLLATRAKNPEITWFPEGTETVTSLIDANRKNVLISYGNQEPSTSLALQFYQAIAQAGHSPFLAGEDQQQGITWTQQLDTQLQHSDYLILFLLQQDSTSEMITEVVRRAKEIQASRSDRKPNILPICVDFPLHESLNYDLSGYLNQVQQREWKDEENSSQLITEVLTLITQNQNWQTVSETEPQTSSSVFFQDTLSTASQHPQPLRDLQTLECPLPVASPEFLELPQGQVELGSKFYITRPSLESLAQQTITQPGALIRIKAPRQMGKTSLMARILHYGAEQKAHVVPLSFQLADSQILQDLERFLQWFCLSIGRRLRLPNQLKTYWDDIFGAKDNCTAYFEEYLLPNLDVPLILGLDEVDCIFQYPQVAADFFGLLRAWHEDAKNRKVWGQLRLVVVHSTEVYIPMDLNQSPFNVGLPLELPEFTPQQVNHLASLHGLVWDSPQISLLMNLVGGHPYLVRLALYHLRQNLLTLEEFLRTAPTEAGLYGDHLRRHLWNLEQYPELAEAMEDVVGASYPIRLESVRAFKLHSMGLVHLEGNEVIPRCQLYRQYFRDRFGCN